MRKRPSRYPALKKIDGKTVCRGCGGEVPKGRQTWCSRACYRLHCPAIVNFHVRERDKGICQICKQDIAELKRQWMLNKPATVNYVTYRNTSVYDRYLTALEDHRRDKVREEYDHIIPFSKGGKTILENMRTLCTPCHKIVTKEFSRLRALERKNLIDTQPATG